MALPRGFCPLRANEMALVGLPLRALGGLPLRGFLGTCSDMPDGAKGRMNHSLRSGSLMKWSR